MSKENKAILEGGLYYVQGTYAAISDTVGFVLPSSYTKTQETLRAQIENDMHRTPFFVQDEKERKNLESRWYETKHDVLQSYDQADPTGSPIPNHLYMQRLLKINSSLYGEDLLKAQELFFRSRENMRFGYMDDNNKVCGVYIAYSTDPKQPGWIMGVLHDAVASPTDRQLHLFTFLPSEWLENPIDKKKLSKLHPTQASNQITSKKIFPRKILPFQQTLKDALNSERVFTLLGNMLNPDGTIKPDFFDKGNLEQRGYKTEGLMITHPPVPKKSEDTVTPSASPLNPKPNTNVTGFIKLARIASEINKNIAPYGYALSEDRHFLESKKHQRDIHIGPQGEMTTDPINTEKTPNSEAVIANIFIIMIRTYSVVFREGGEDNFPSEKMNLNLEQQKGALDSQKANFLRLEAKVRELIIAEIEANIENGHYPPEFIQKIRFNNGPLVINVKKRPADVISEPKDKEEADETEVASKRPRAGSK